MGTADISDKTHAKETRSRKQSILHTLRNVRCLNLFHILNDINSLVSGASESRNIPNKSTGATLRSLTAL